MPKGFSFLGSSCAVASMAVANLAQVLWALQGAYICLLIFEPFCIESWHMQYYLKVRSWGKAFLHFEIIWLLLETEVWSFMA